MSDTRNYKILKKNIDHIAIKNLSPKNSTVTTKEPELGSQYEP